MTQSSDGHSGRPPRCRAHYLARIAWLRTSGMSALLVLLVFVVFVLPALISFGTAWHVVTDIAVILILVSGVVAVVEHRRLATSLAIVSVLVIAMRIAEWFTPHELLPVLRDISTAERVAAARHRRRHQRLRPRPCDRRPVVRRNRGLSAAGIDLGRPVLGRRGPFARGIFRAPRRKRRD